MREDNMARTNWCVLGVASLALVIGISAVSAQAPQRVRIRGTIEKVDGATMTIKARDGKDVMVKQDEKFGVQGLAKASLADLNNDTFIGVTAMPQPDGSQKAIAIHIFTEQQRKVVPQTFGPWDLQPNSTMTNAVVASKISNKDGNILTVKYKDGEKKVLVTPETAIVKVVPGDKTEIKPGAKIIIMGAVKGPDGTLTTNGIYVGKDGIAPPM
jgi:outer membrane lipoprotein SlyB